LQSSTFSHFESEARSSECSSRQSEDTEPRWLLYGNVSLGLFSAKPFCLIASCFHSLWIGLPPYTFPVYKDQLHYSLPFKKNLIYLNTDVYRYVLAMDSSVSRQIYEVFFRNGGSTIVTNPAAFSCSPYAPLLPFERGIFF
jgi:hypothetical protein